MSEDRKGDGPSLFDEYAAIRKAPGLSAPEKLLLWAIHSRAGNGKGVCTASAATLAMDVGEDHLKPQEPDTPEAREARLGAAARSVRNWLRALRNAGWIADEDGRKPHDPRPRVIMGPKFHESMAVEAAHRGGLVLGNDVPSAVGNPIPSTHGIAIPSSGANWEKSGDLLGKSTSQLGKSTQPTRKNDVGTRKNDVGNSERGFLQTTPRTASENSSYELTRANSLSESGSTRVCGEKNKEALKAHPSGENDHVEALLGTDVAGFLKAIQPPQDAWWGWEDQDKALAVCAVNTFLKDAVPDPLGFVERIARGLVKFRDVAAAVEAASCRELALIGSLEKYTRRIANEIASGDQEASCTATRWMEMARSQLEEKREKACVEWDQATYRKAMDKHLPGAARILDRLEAIDVANGVQEPAENSLVYQFKGDLPWLALFMPTAEGWERYAEVMERVFADNSHADMVDVGRTFLAEEYGFDVSELEAPAQGVTGNGPGKGVGNGPGNGVGNAMVTGSATGACVT